MRSYSEIDINDLNQIPAGELLENVAVRSPDFKSIWFESTITATTSNGEFVVSLLVTDRKDVGYVLRTRSADGVVGFDIDKVLSHQVLTEVGQLRTSRSVAAEMALILLEEIKRADPNFLNTLGPRLSALAQGAA